MGDLTACVRDLDAVKINCDKANTRVRMFVHTTIRDVILRVLQRVYRCVRVSRLFPRDFINKTTILPYASS